MQCNNVADNLVRAKKISKEWDKKHKASIQKDLKEIEESIEVMYQRNENGVFILEETERMKALESKKEKIMDNEEKNLTLKAELCGLKQGTRTPKIFTIMQPTGGM